MLQWNFLYFLEKVVHVCVSTVYSFSAAAAWCCYEEGGYIYTYYKYKAKAVSLVTELLQGFDTASFFIFV
jgi:hypothetical protein